MSNEEILMHEVAELRARLAEVESGTTAMRDALIELAQSFRALAMAAQVDHSGPKN